MICTYTNAKLGSIEVVKHTNGGDGTFAYAGSGDGVDSSFQIATSSGTGAKAFDGLAAGSYSITESQMPAGWQFDSLDCGDASGVSTNERTATIALAAGENVTCTYTNSKLPTIKVIKTLVPSTDDGTFNFAIDGQTFDNGGDGYGDGGHTDAISVGLGDHTVSETGNGPTQNADYVSSFVCTSGESQVAAGNGTTIGLSNLQAGEDVVCTFTNSRRPTITVNKVVLPSTDPGTFDFTIDPGEGQLLLDNHNSGYGNGGSTGQVNVTTGDHTITESGHGNTSASDYASAWSCSTKQSGSGTAISLSNLQYGDQVVCTFTNTRLATLIVKKVVDNSNGGGSKQPGDFTIHVSTAGLDLPNSPKPGSSSGTTYGHLLPGTYKVSEDPVSGYSLTGISGCLADGSIILAAGQTATCTLTNTSAAPPPPPPPPPPAPKVDIQITKKATPNPATLGNRVTWTMVVTNNGPDGATGVTVADPLPAGTSFVSVATSQGSCTGGALISCQLGSMPVGTSVTITLVTRATATGTLTNTATTVANEPETNSANNTATASTVVKGAFVPKVVYCTALVVSPKSIFVGRRSLLTMKVSQHGKAVAGIRVRIKGSTVSIVTKPSNSRGLIGQHVQPKKAGILVFTPIAKKSCSNPRIGVIGVLTPPVTG